MRVINDDHSETSKDGDDSVPPAPSTSATTETTSTAAAPDSKPTMTVASALGASPSSPNRTQAASSSAPRVTPDSRSQAAHVDSDSSPSVASPTTTYTASSAREAAAAAAAALARRFSQPARKKATAKRPSPKDEVLESPTTTQEESPSADKPSLSAGGREERPQAALSSGSIHPPLPDGSDQQPVRRQLETAFSPLSTQLPDTANTPPAASSVVPTDYTGAFEKFLEAEKARQLEAKEDRELLRALLEPHQLLLVQQNHVHELNQRLEQDANREREKQHTELMAMRLRELDTRIREMTVQKIERAQRREEFTAVTQCLRDATAALHQQREELTKRQRCRRDDDTATSESIAQQPPRQHGGEMCAAHAEEIAQLRAEVGAEREERARALAAMYEAIQKSLAE